MHNYESAPQPPSALPTSADSGGLAGASHIASVRGSGSVPANVSAGGSGGAPIGASGEASAGASAVASAIASAAASGLASGVTSGAGFKVAVVGARGYSGLELCRLLLRHPQANLTGCFATDAGFTLSHYLPEDAARKVPTWTMAEFEEKIEGLHTLFLATPAEVSLELAPRALKKNVNVVDLSGAFRLKQGSSEERAKKYRKWYGLEHSALELLLQAQYGLQPFQRPPPGNNARLIANPGCYATAVLMATLPLLDSGLIRPETLVIDAKSGTSGGGRKAAENLLFTEVEGECLPYKVAKHQHWPEIVEAAWLLAQEEIAPFFTTSLLNVRRGIIASLYTRLRDVRGTDVDMESKVHAAYAEAFSGYKLVRFGALGRPETDSLLSLKRVVGTPRTHISFRVDGDKLYVFSALDNLVKGAAGQAIENFNRLCDRPCELGLTAMEGVL